MQIRCNAIIVNSNIRTYVLNNNLWKWGNKQRLVPSSPSISRRLRSRPLALSSMPPVAMREAQTLYTFRTGLLSPYQHAPWDNGTAKRKGVLAAYRDNPWYWELSRSIM